MEHLLAVLIFRGTNNQIQQIVQLLSYWETKICISNGINAFYIENLPPLPPHTISILYNHYIQY